MRAKPMTVYIMLGSNVGRRKAMIAKARFLISNHCGDIVKLSSIYETEPWGEKNQNKFINQVIELRTHLGCRELLENCKRIEEHLGKSKITKYGPRNIDIDILFYGLQTFQEEDLQIPHPRLHERNFVLDPLDEIASEYIHPIFNVSIHQLKLNSSDICQTVKLTD